MVDKLVTMVMSDEASEVRRVIYLQRDRERAVYAGDRGEHDEKVKQQEAKKIKKNICTKKRISVKHCSSGQTRQR